MATLPHFVIAPTTCGKTQSTDSILGWGHGRPHATLTLSIDPTYAAEGLAAGPTSELTGEKAIHTTAAMRNCWTTSNNTTIVGSTQRRRLALDGCKGEASSQARSSALVPSRDTSLLEGTRHKWLHQPIPPRRTAGQTTRPSPIEVSAAPPTRRCPSCIGPSRDRVLFCTTQYETAAKSERLVTSRSLKHSREAMHTTPALSDVSPSELLPLLRLSRPSRLPGSHSAILKGALGTTPSRTVSARMPQVLDIAPSLPSYVSAMPHYMHPHSVATKTNSGPHHG
jgi:hypothetical protein